MGTQPQPSDVAGRQYPSSGKCGARANAAHNAKFISFGKG